MPSSILQVSEDLYKYQVASFSGSGMDSFTNPPAQNPEYYELLKNVFPGHPGMKVRWGYTSMSVNPATARFLGMYQNDSTGARRIIYGNATKFAALNEDGTSYNATIRSTSGGQGRALSSRSYLYMYTGNAADAQKWDGSAASGVTKWGIVAPPTAIGLGVTGAGAITLKNGRNYYAVFKNSTTQHHSDLSPISASTGPITGQNQPLTNIPVSADAQVDKVVVLATADGGDPTTLYYVGEVNNGTTTMTDNTSETSLLAGNIYYEIDSDGIEHGVVGNGVPPTGTLCVKHKGRLVMNNGQYLNFSKSFDETVTSTGTTAGHYEECWPADWRMDISEGTESVRGLMSDGTMLYIGTERMVRRIYGDNINNFSKPEVVFNETGVLCHNVWQRVFMEGQPVGTIWVTPDYRVIQSDFNSYRDIGTPIQTLLSTINRTNSTKASAMAVSNGAHDLYILAVPLGSATEPDTLFVYNLRSQTWAVWYPQVADASVESMLFNIKADGSPQPMFTTPTALYAFSDSATNDGGSAIPVAITSSWLNLGDPLARKVLNEIELYVTDSAATVTLQAASLQNEFTTPTTIVSGASLVASPFGPYKLFLAGYATKDRFYRFTVSTSATPAQGIALGGFGIEFSSVNKL